MKRKGKLMQIYQLDIYSFLFQGQDQSVCNFDNLRDMESIFKCVHNYITDDTKNAFYYIPILDTFEKHNRNIFKNVFIKLLLKFC